MNCIKSCGFVVFKEINKQIYFLIIKSINGDVGFPKGHVENDESELQTAVRELKEETNVDIEYIEGFRYLIEYRMPKFDNALKQVVYFLGKCTNDYLRCQESEVLEARFVSYEEALENLSFEETKNILKYAKEYINELIVK